MQFYLAIKKKCHISERTLSTGNFMDMWMDKLWQQELDIDDHIESSQEVELDECLVSACFLLFIQSSIPA